MAWQKRCGEVDRAKSEVGGLSVVVRLSLNAGYPVDLPSGVISFQRAANGTIEEGANGLRSEDHIDVPHSTIAAAVAQP